MEIQRVAHRVWGIVKVTHSWRKRGSGFCLLGSAVLGGTHGVSAVILANPLSFSSRATGTGPGPERLRNLPQSPSKLVAGGGLEVRGPDTGSVNTHSTVMRVYIRFCLTTSGSEFRGGGRLSDFHQKPVGASGNGKLKCECPSDGDLLCRFSVSLGTLFPPCHCHGFSTKHTQQKSRLQPCRGPSGQLRAPGEKGNQKTRSRHGTSPRPRVRRPRPSFAFPVMSPHAPGCSLLPAFSAPRGQGQVHWASR